MPTTMIPVPIIFIGVIGSPKHSYKSSMMKIRLTPLII